MATYLELFELKDDSNLQDKVTVAVVKAAHGIANDATPPANQAARLAWAATVVENPVAVAQKMLWVLLAGSSELSAAQIAGASDTAIQSAVDGAVDLFAGE